MTRLEQIERKLGRQLDPAQSGSIDNLNDVPDWLVEEARSLQNPMLAERLLQYFTRPENGHLLKLFVQDVILGNVSPREWLRGRVLVPALSLEEQLLWKRARLLAPIGGEFRARTVPDLALWDAGVGWVGAPAMLEPNADYNTPVPDHAASLAIAETEQVADPVVALRRWIAGRLARSVWYARQPGLIADLSELAEGLPSPDRWSEDAQIAARALLREMRESSPSEGQVPGFRGPDAWYREEPR